MATERVNLDIEARSPADAAILEMQKKVKALQAELKAAGKAGSEGASEIRKGMGEAAQGADRFGQVIGKLGPMLAGAFSVEALRRFFDYMESRSRELAQKEGQRRMSLAQALAGTGDDASQQRAGAVGGFLQNVLRRNPLVNEQDVLGAYSASRSVLLRDGEFGRSLDVAGLGLEYGATMAPGQREALIRSLALAERSAPSPNRDAMLTRLAQLSVYTQTTGARGTEGLMGVSSVMALQGGRDANEMFLRALAASSAAGVEGGSPEAAIQLVGIAQRAFAARDQLTGQRMFPAIRSEQDAYAAILEGRISTDALQRAGLVGGEMAPRLRNLQRNYGEQFQMISGATPAVLGERAAVVQRVLGEELPRAQAARALEESNAGERERALARQRERAEMVLQYRQLGLPEPLARLAGAAEQNYFALGGLVPSAPSRTNVSVTVQDGIPAQAEVN